MAQIEAGQLLGVMEALETRLATIPGLRTSAFERDNVHPPVAVVGLPDIDDYRLTMRRGHFELQFRVVVLVSANFDVVSQRQLAEYASTTGDKSIPAVLEEDQTLGGAAEVVRVHSFRVLGLVDNGASKYSGGEWVVTVVAKGQ